MREKPRRLFITDRDLEILKFLWRWKLASTAALSMRFFPGIGSFTPYHRLLQLEGKKYIRHVSFRYRKGGAWALDTVGFRFIAPYLPELHSKAFRSENPLHDYYASAFHLGEWLMHRPLKGAICSEQELRCVDPGLLPKWLPEGKHRPDGFTAFDSGSGAHLFAFECELSQKSSARYEEIVAFYDEAETIAGVFWLAATPTIESAVRRPLGNASHPKRHHFMQLDAFRRTGWNTPFTGGAFQGKSLASLLVNNVGTVEVKSRYGNCVAAFLQNAKRPILPSEKRVAAGLAPSD